MSLGSVVVTGSGDGIGRAIAIRLAADGWSVVGLELDPKAAESLGKSLGDGHRAISRRRLRSLRAQGRARGSGEARAAARLGQQCRHRRDGQSARTQRRRRSSGCHRGQPDVAFLGRRPRRSRPGSGIARPAPSSTSSSVHGRSAFNMWAAYDVAKAGIDALTRYIAVEYGPVGIRANAVAPGAIRTAAGAAGDPRQPRQRSCRTRNVDPASAGTDRRTGRDRRRGRLAALVGGVIRHRPVAGG